MKLNRNVIKFIAVICMVLDHVAYSFLDYRQPLFHIFRFFGRCTAPIMCYFLAEGWRHTRSKKKYILRMFIFGLISYLPYLLMSRPYLLSGYGSFWPVECDMQLTLTLCLVMLAALDYAKDHLPDDGSLALCQLLIVAAACLLSNYGDWLYFAPLWVAGFYLYHDDEKKQWLCYVFVGLLACLYNLMQWAGITGSFETALLYNCYTLGFLLAYVLLRCYDHTAGRLKLKYFFYAFYPLHIVIIVIIKYSLTIA